MMQRFIAALNSISSPILAVLVICLGCGYSILSKKYGLDGNTAAGIVGAGIGLLTGQVLSSTRTETVEGHPPITTQSTGVPITNPIVTASPAPENQPPVTK
jgi:hypothetical protein